MTTNPHDGRRVLTQAGLVLSFGIFSLNGVVIYDRLVGSSVSPDVSQYRAVALGVAVVALVIASLGAALVRRLQPGTVVAAALVVCVALLALTAGYAWLESGTAPPDLTPDPLGDLLLGLALLAMFLVMSPASWPLLSFGVAAGLLRIRAQSHPATRTSRVF